MRDHCYIYQIVVCICVCFAFVFINNNTLRKLYKQTYRIHSLIETTESVFVLACASLYMYIAYRHTEYLHRKLETCSVIMF